MPKKKQKRKPSLEVKINHEQYRKKISDKEAYLQELRNTLEQEELTIKDCSAKLEEVREQRDEIESLLTRQVIEKEDFIDAAVDTHEEIEEKRDSEVAALTEREEKEKRDKTAELSESKQEVMRLKQTKNHLVPLAFEKKRLQTSIFEKEQLVQKNTVLFKDTLYDTDRNQLIDLNTKKTALGNKIDDLVTRFRKVSKLQVERSNALVFRENLQLAKRLQNIDPKAHFSLVQATGLKQEWTQWQRLARTYQDLRLPRTTEVIDGTIQILSKQNSEKRSIIQSLVNKYRAMEDEIAVLSSEDELEVMHQIREVERALATHRVHSASSRETIKQTRASIGLACRVKEQLGSTVKNFRDVCRMMIGDVVKHQRGITKNTVLSLFASFQSHPKVDVIPVSHVRPAIHHLAPLKRDRRQAHPAVY